MLSKICHHWAKSSAKGREQGGHGTSARSRRPCSHLRDVHLLTLLGQVVRRKRRWRRICWGGGESGWDWHRGNKLPDGEVDQLRLFRRWQRVFDHLGKYWTNRNLDLIDTNFTISNIYEILSYISRSSIIRATLSLGLNGEMVERPRRLIAKWTCKKDEFRILEEHAKQI